MSGTDIKDMVERSRAAQGLPPRVDDPVVLSRLAKLLEVQGSRRATAR